LSSEERRKETEDNEREPVAPEPGEEPANEPAEDDPSVVEAPDEGNPPDGTQPDEVLEDIEIVEEGSSEDISDVDIEAIQEELEATRLERDQHRDDMMYLRAEFDNARKRQEREMERVMRNASERLVNDLLPILDNLERALEVEGDVRGGVQATLEQFAAVLGEQGLTPVPSDGEPFDPNVHEAVMSEPSEEHEENTVLRTFQRGYTLNGKPIRTAKVVVAG
jgi:molecular chaperone GrpE